MPSDYNESTFVSLAVYNTLTISILVFLVRQNAEISVFFSSIIRLLNVVLIFLPIQVLLFPPKILYAAKILSQQESYTFRNVSAKQNSFEQSHLIENRNSLIPRRSNSAPVPPLPNAPSSNVGTMKRPSIVNSLSTNPARSSSHLNNTGTHSPFNISQTHLPGQLRTSQQHLSKI